jgi:hypothetical protein
MWRIFCAHPWHSVALSVHHQIETTPCGMQVRDTYGPGWRAQRNVARHRQYQRCIQYVKPANVARATAIAVTRPRFGRTHAHQPALGLRLGRRRGVTKRGLECRRHTACMHT